jgi:hypothetical protein
MEHNKYDRNKDSSLVSIHTLLKKLGQQVEQAEWDGKPCEHLRQEHKTVSEYHSHTGSNYYPNF